jgi:Zn-dependent peptidase ImmA (M78 family)
VLGAVFLNSDTRRFLVVIDQRLADNDAQRSRYRMTVAEELAHLILHGEIIRRLNDVGEFQQLQRHAQWNDLERNAKRFAAAVLMPGSVLLEEANVVYSGLVKVAGYGNIDVIQKYPLTPFAIHLQIVATWTGGPGM